MPVISGDTRVAQAVAAAATQRVHHFLISDSNTVLNGYGWDHGLQYGLSQRQAMFSTGFACPAASDNLGNGIGYTWGNSFVDFGVTTGLDAALAVYAEDSLSSLGRTFDYGYLADGNTFAYTLGSEGIILQADCLLDVNANLRWDGWWGSFDSGAGSFKPSARRGSSPYTSLATGSVINTNTGEKTINKATLELPAAVRDFIVEIGYTTSASGSPGVVGPIVLFFNKVVNTDRAAGFAFTTLCYRGGKSARTHAQAIQAQADEFYANLFGAARQDAIDEGQDPVICVWLNSGLNDRNETLTSVGPAAVTDGDSPEAFYDNNLAMIQKLQSVWTDNGWSLSELNFIVMPSHPVSNPDDSELLSYRAAAVDLAGACDRVMVVDINEAYDSNAFGFNGWYLGGADTSHLEQIGYETIGAGVVNYILEAAPSAATAVDPATRLAYGDASIATNVLDTSTRRIKVIAGDSITIGAAAEWLRGVPRDDTIAGWLSRGGAAFNFDDSGKWDANATVPAAISADHIPPVGAYAIDFQGGTSGADSGALFNRMASNSLGVPNLDGTVSTVAGMTEITGDDWWTAAAAAGDITVDMWVIQHADGPVNSDCQLQIRRDSTAVGTAYFSGYAASTQLAKVRVTIPQGTNVTGEMGWDLRFRGSTATESGKTLVVIPIFLVRRATGSGIVLCNVAVGGTSLADWAGTNDSGSATQDFGDLAVDFVNALLGEETNSFLYCALGQNGSTNNAGKSSAIHAADYQTLLGRYGVAGTQNIAYVTHDTTGLAGDDYHGDGYRSVADSRSLLVLNGFAAFPEYARLDYGIRHNWSDIPTGKLLQTRSVVYYGSTYYICKTRHTKGATDPSADTTNWDPVTITQTGDNAMRMDAADINALLSDGTHPNLGGYRTMAMMYWALLRTAAQMQGNSGTGFGRGGRVLQRFNLPRFGIAAVS